MTRARMRDHMVVRGASIGTSTVRAVVIARLCTAAIWSMTIDRKRAKSAAHVRRQPRARGDKIWYDASPEAMRHARPVRDASPVDEHQAAPAEVAVRTEERPLQRVAEPSSADHSEFVTLGVGLGCAIAALAAFAASIGHVDATRAGSLGLATQAGVGFWVAVVMTCVGFTFTLARTPHRSVLLSFNLIALLFCVYALSALSEAVPRFQVAWLHAGFAEYVARTGHVIPQLDGRFAWPGMFTATAFFEQVAGISSGVTLIRWAPLFFALAYLAPLWAIASSLTHDRRAKWLTLWVFAIGNWVGQDYLSPQALTFLLYLIIVAIVLRWFRSEPSPGQTEVPPASTRPAQLAALSAILLAVFLACVLAHPFTPLFVIGFIAALALRRRLISPGLALVTALIFLSWLSWGAVTFWIGHRSQVFPGFSSTGSNVQANVGAHFANAAGGRSVVLVLRLVMAQALLGIALVGLWLRRRSGRAESILVLGLALPFPIVLLQDYGGEALLRAYLFALPFLALAAAYALTTHPHARTPHPLSLPWLIVAIASAVGIAGSVTVRYGNESFEQVRSADLAAVQFAYANSRPGDVLVALNSSVPWRYRDIETRDYETLVENRLPRNFNVTSAVRGLSHHTRNVLVIVTPGEQAYGDIFVGYPPGWMSRIQRQLDTSPAFRRLYDADGAQVYRLVPERSPQGVSHAA